MRECRGGWVGVLRMDRNVCNASIFRVFTGHRYWFLVGKIRRPVALGNVGREWPSFVYIMLLFPTNMFYLSAPFFSSKALSSPQNSLNKNARLMLTDNCMDAIDRVTVSKGPCDQLWRPALGTYDHVSENPFDPW